MKIRALTDTTCSKSLELRSHILWSGGAENSKYNSLLQAATGLVTAKDCGRRHQTQEATGHSRWFGLPIGASLLLTANIVRAGWFAGATKQATRGGLVSGAVKG